MTTSRRSAFTLVELIAVMVVISVIGAVGAMTIQRAAAANAQVSTRGALYAEASAAMDRIVRKVQSTPVRAASNPAAPSIASFTAATIAWDDQSALTWDAAAGTLVLRDVTAGDATGAAPVLIANVSDFSAAPFDQSNSNILTALGVTTLNAAQSGTIQRVSFQFTVTRDGQSVTLRSRAFPRCAMVRTVAP
ncbi:MAG TPA: prepilin-type N-terminal cleavage/methylation domain-containing protein [Phycisphaerales bacterium]|nr:prepilin-type N-terminal cleavage/methylation domain-containing protein [Phycisphaerales bacterium]